MVDGDIQKQSSYGLPQRAFVVIEGDAVVSAELNSSLTAPNARKRPNQRRYPNGQQGSAPIYTEKAKQGLAGSDAVLVILQAAFASLLIWQIR